ncbi:hypothetical protein GCM10008959_00060 [Deinococcus seoulensis]|uniref:WD40 repeat domain-containing protein n=1 Tax=Deinococcus seoulensis TaxID=1837379 RepID=A0ABQ2RNZ3_9DEIO|nr:hypothetical protein [Deinococcus seoulensis]GGR43190.1 hypothetical protein GCM10008959_00060 [Deinococcus seoulensis]
MNTPAPRSGLLRQAIATTLTLGVLAHAQTDTPPTPPAYPVTLIGGRVVSVSAPAPDPHPDGGWMEWKLDQRQPSLDGRFHALLFRQSSNNPKHDPITVHLVKPDGRVLPLKNGDVFDVTWMPDGQYLLGRGNNTLRLWNTSGGLRTRVLPGMEALDVKPGVVCVATLPAGNTVGLIVQRFHVPSLRPLGEYTITGVPTNRRFCR